jgi:hypothetical protein
MPHEVTVIPASRTCQLGAEAERLVGVAPSRQMKAKPQARVSKRRFGRVTVLEAQSA